MELESFIWTLSVLLELVGLLSVLAATLSRRSRWGGAAEVILIGCLCGLGSVTMISAMLRLMCGLIAGFSVVAMGLAVIFLSDRVENENPLDALTERHPDEFAIGAAPKA